jgi:hypothetical protein
VRLLGPVSAETDAVRLRLGGRKHRAVFALLALQVNSPAALAGWSTSSGTMSRPRTRRCRCSPTSLGCAARSPRPSQGRSRDTYEVERLPAIKKTLFGTDAATRAVTRRHAAGQHLVDGLARLLFGFEPVRDYLTRSISEAGINYRGGGCASSFYAESSVVITAPLRWAHSSARRAGNTVRSTVPTRAAQAK